jgi:NADH-quinone oxidoreductase subunit G
MSKKEVVIYIDGKEIKALPGERLLDVALRNGIDIPHLCYHPALKVAGSCRLCLVEIEGVPKLVPSCNTYVKEGMRVKTESERVKKVRKLMLEMLLINHPLDCPVCDKSSECKLQEYVHKYGPSVERTKEERRRYKRVPISDVLLRNMNRCVHCTRCVRFIRDVIKTGEYGVFGRGNTREIGVFIPEKLSNKYQGNLYDLCPVGALMWRDFRFKKRVWFLEKKESICPLCATGCNIDVYYNANDNRIYRIKPRLNEKVNGYFMCDIGRDSFHNYESNRIDSAYISGESVDIEKAIYELYSLLKDGKGYAVIGGANLVNEDLYVLKRFMDTVKNTEYVDYRVSKVQREEDFGLEDDFLIRKDKHPNSRGAMYFGFNKKDISAIKEAIKRGDIDVLLVLDEDIGEEEYRDFSGVKVVYMGSVWNKIAKESYIVFPTLSPFEAGGSYINYDGYVQMKSKVLKEKDSVVPIYSIFLRLAEIFGKEIGKYMGYEDINADMNLPTRIT